MVAMQGSTPQVNSLTVADIMSVRVSQRSVNVPVSGSMYTSLENVTGVPHDGGGFSLTRLQAIDAMISRIRGSAEALYADLSNTQLLEDQHDLALEQMAQTVEGALAEGRHIPGITEGFLLDIVA